MTIEQRIERLTDYIGLEEEQRDWLLAADWHGDGDAKLAIEHHTRNIALYENLVLRCINHL